MTASSSSKNTIALIPVLIAALVAIGLVAAWFYLSKPAPKQSEGAATQEAKAYLPNLALSEVTMQASESFVNQQVVEILGKISNNGARDLASIEVYCLFYGVDGHEVRRERLAIIGGPGSMGALKAGGTRTFRLPFENLPPGWNQAVPKMVIAQILFGS